MILEECGECSHKWLLSSLKWQECLHGFMYLRYRTYAGDEIAIITTAPPPVAEITQSHKRSDVP